MELDGFCLRTAAFYHQGRARREMMFLKSITGGDCRELDWVGASSSEVRASGGGTRLFPSGPHGLSRSP